MKPGDRVTVNEDLLRECFFCKKALCEQLHRSNGVWALGCIGGGQAEYVRVPTLRIRD